MVRTYIQLDDDTHKYLTGVAHERTLAEGKHVSVSKVVSEICVIAVEEMRRREGATT
jgi:hypothetical protein